MTYKTAPQKRTTHDETPTKRKFLRFWGVVYCVTYFIYVPVLLCRIFRFICRSLCYFICLQTTQTTYRKLGVMGCVSLCVAVCRCVSLCRAYFFMPLCVMSLTSFCVLICLQQPPKEKKVYFKFILMVGLCVDVSFMSLVSFVSFFVPLTSLFCLCRCNLFSLRRLYLLLHITTPPTTTDEASETINTNETNPKQKESS